MRVKKDRPQGGPGTSSMGGSTEGVAVAVLSPSVVVGLLLPEGGCAVSSVFCASSAQKCENPFDHLSLVERSAFMTDTCNYQLTEQRLKTVPFELTLGKWYGDACE